MMSEVRLEVISERDAIEYCRENGLIFDKVYTGKGSNAGKLMMLAFNPKSQNCNTGKVACSNDEIPRYAVCVSDRGPLYLADKTKCVNKYTYVQNQAKLFTYKRGVQTANYMSKRGLYTWVCVKVL